MKYFSRIILIVFACGHRKRGIDTYQQFVTDNKVDCPACNSRVVM